MGAIRQLVLAFVVATLAAPVAVASPPANDAYPGVTIDSLPYNSTGSTVEATGEVDEPDPGEVSLRADCIDSVTPDSGCLRSVWFALPPGTGEHVTAETCESSFDTVLAAYTTYGDLVPSLGNLGPGIHSDDDNNTCASNPLSSTLTFESFAGAWHRLVIDGFEADAGDYVLHVYRGPNTNIQITTSQSDDDRYASPLPVALGSTLAPATFECSLDGSAFAPCVSLLGQPVSLDAANASFNVAVAPGPHTLAARARDTNGNADPYPAVLSWTSLAPPPPPPPPPPPTTFVPLLPQVAPTPPTARLTVVPQKLGRALKRGLRVSLQTNVAGTVSARATIGGKLARKLHFVRRPRTVLVASGSARIASPSSVKIILRFTTKAKAKLRQAPRVPLTIRAKVSGSGASATAIKRITLRR